MSLKKHAPKLLWALGAVLVLGALRPPAKTALDSASFTALPVLHNGRVKPLDTVARSSMLTLLGKQRVKDAGGRRLAPGPWLLDVMLRPAEADRAKVFMVNDPDVLGMFGKKPEDGRFYSFEDISGSLEAIRSQAVQAANQEASKRDRFQAALVQLESCLTLYQSLKNTLQVEDTVNLPAELGAYASIVESGVAAAHRKGGDFNRDLLTRMMTFVERYRFLSQAGVFRPLPPLSGEDPQGFAGTGDSLLSAMNGEPPHPALAQLAQISDAYRQQDAVAFALAVGRYSAWVEEHLPRSAARARWEVLFNRAEPFYIGILLYVLILMLCFMSWLVWPEELQRGAYGLLLLTLALHTVGLATRMWLEGRPPVTNLYSSAVFIGWFAVLLSVIVERWSRRGFGTLAAAVLGAATLIIAHNLTGSGDTMEMMRAVLDSNFWLATHVITVTIGYSSTFLAGILAVVYILRGSLTSSLDKDTAKSLSAMVYGVICFSLFFSFVGTVLGGIWADQSWGRFWGWDPKENGALLIVLWNAIILHARWGGYVRDRGIMIMAVFGNLITAMSWFGVNMLGIGLHSYGFMDKAFWALAAFSALQLLIMAVGALPPSRWRSARHLAA